MRYYTIAMTALAIDAPQKWTDNVVSIDHSPDVLSQQRGVARRISHAGLIRLALVRQLHALLGMSVTTALGIAKDLLKDGEPAVLHMGQLALSFDRAALEQAVNGRLAAALESAPVPRRGRPPKRP